MTQTAVYTGTQDDFNNTVRLIKQDINFVETLDNVTVAAELDLGFGCTLSNTSGTIVAKGIKSIFHASFQVRSFVAMSCPSVEINRPCVLQF